MAIGKRQTISSVIYLTLLLCFSPADALAQSAPGGEWTKPFTPDRHTVVLYHFDEGEGNETHDAGGDRELTLRANKQALWERHEGFGTSARFLRRDDDPNVLVGPINNDKLELRGCKKEWTIEAWVRHTSGTEQNGYRNICGTDDEGVGMTPGVRAGWNFCLIAPKVNRVFAPDRGVVPHARFMGSYSRAPGHDVNQIGISNTTSVIDDDQWHHVAWQFRFEDQMHFMFIDGKLIYQEKRPDGRTVINDAPRCDLPFTVGGFLHSQEAPSHFDIARLRLTNYGNFEGEIDELRISSVMRYPVAERLAIVRRELPEAGLNLPYRIGLSTDAARGAAARDNVTWGLAEGELPSGLVLDRDRGVLHGIPTEVVSDAKLTIQVTDAGSGQTDKHAFTLAVRPGSIAEDSIPLAFAGSTYRHRLQTRRMSDPVRWKIRNGTLPEGMRFNETAGEISGVPAAVTNTRLQFEASDKSGTAYRDLTLKAVPKALRHLGPDEHTVALWNWQAPGSRLIPDLKGDEELTLTWANLKSDTRLPRAGWGRYPYFIGGGEGGYVGPQHNDKLDLRTSKTGWTVEAWVRPGGPVDGYGRKFDFGHVCGTYDNSQRGVWELYLSSQNSPDGSLAPGVHFFGAEPDQALENLHPWSKPQGIVADRKNVGIHDTRWHHIAWQYSYADDLHQLFLDGRLIWQMNSPNGRKLINNRRHDAQFSVGARLSGYARYGGEFNWLGPGNFFGQIGEIRISNIRRYEE